MKIICDDKLKIKSFEISNESLVGTDIEISKYSVHDFEKLIEENGLSITISDNNDCNDNFVIVHISKKL
ncbi:MAG: hypothetical protein LBD41_01760 [Clostridiales Family XIII bacterium]|jgi:hypothetical protein|nr:hypothetical protein [Clostridiales Family XIII bacterium]